MDVWKPLITGALSDPRDLAQSCAFRIISPGQDCEQKNAMGRAVISTALPHREGDSIAFARICAHTIFDVVVDYEIQLIIRKIKMARQYFVYIINGILGFLNFE